MSMICKHDYEIKAYYPRNLGGHLAMHTWHDGTASRDMEIEAYRARMWRGEIGHIEVISNVDPVGVTTLSE
jgi:hypothetical protein